MEFVFIAVAALALYLGYRFMFFEVPSAKKVEEDKPTQPVAPEVVAAPVKIRKTRAKKVIVKSKKPRSTTK